MSIFASGHQPKTGTTPNTPYVGTSVKIPTITPVSDKKEVVELVDKLNGLLDRYKTLFEVYLRLVELKPLNTLERLGAVLNNVENAIDAVCCELSQEKYILQIPQAT